MTNFDEVLWRLERIENFLIELSNRIGCDDYSHDEAQDAMENIEQEIIARACRNGVCED